MASDMGERKVKEPTIGNTITFVRKAHEGQTDKGGKPYWLHPASVATRLPEWVSDRVYMAALLHDVIEDTPTTRADLIRMGYHLETIEIVEWVTRRKDDGLTYQQWVENIAKNGPIGALLVKLADNTDNSDPVRIAQLPESERGITRRYERSMRTLREALSARFNIQL